MKTEIELTEAEEKLIVKIIQRGHTIKSIIKSENKFDVKYKYLGGNAWGGEGIVYDLVGNMIELAQDIRDSEAWLRHHKAL